MTWWKIAIGKSGHTSTTAYPLIGVLEVTGGQSQRNPILPQGRLGNETRSSIACFGEVPNCRQRNHRSKKADYKNVQRVGVGVVGHSIGLSKAREPAL